MDTFSAFRLAQQAELLGQTVRVFDWNKAALLIKERQPKEAVAGLELDLEWTSGTIYENGAIIEDSYTYLSSNWATPVLILDGETIDCWVYKGEGNNWNAESKWPQSAKDILNDQS